MSQKKIKNAGPVEIINFDPLIPNEYKLRAVNPHPDLPQHPGMNIISAGTSGGKTNLLLNFIMRMVCHKLYIFLRDESEDKYLYLRDVFQQINDLHNKKYDADRPLSDIFEIHAGVDKLPTLDNINKKIQNIIVFDDLVTGNRDELKKIEMLYTLARKRNCSLFFLTQSYFDVPRIVRLQAHHIYLFDVCSNKEVRQLCDEVGKGIPYPAFKKMYLKAVEEPFSFLTINARKHRLSDKFRIKLSGKFDDDDFRE